MNDLLRSHHPVRHIKSFKYAFKGVLHVMLNEANFRVQLLYTFLVVVLGFYFAINRIEWAIIVLSLGFLLASEILNTVIEEFIDYLIDHEHKSAKVIKDLSAGFVLTVAITTGVIFILVFFPRFYQLIL